jgi:hypothetical protein
MTKPSLIQKLPKVGDMIVMDNSSPGILPIPELEQKWPMHNCYVDYTGDSEYTYASYIRASDLYNAYRSGMLEKINYNLIPAYNGWQGDTVFFYDKPKALHVLAVLQLHKVDSSEDIPIYDIFLTDGSAISVNRHYHHSTVGLNYSIDKKCWYW